jgi:hypothetical protein
MKDKLKSKKRETEIIRENPNYLKRFGKERQKEELFY